MLEVSTLEAKADFLKLIRLLETKQEDCITITRNGRPVAQIIPIEEAPVPNISNRIGIAEGRLGITGDFDADNEEIADLMTEEKL